MSVYIGMGCNIEPRRESIDKALRELESIAELVKISPIYETPALLPENAHPSWCLPFLNMAVSVETQDEPLVLLEKLKIIEKKLNRTDSPRWAPRTIDLDILVWEGKSFSSPELKIPHPQIHKRAFVLDPLKDIDPSFIADARKHPLHSPMWMAIMNVTPDSFSDGGQLSLMEVFQSRVKEYEKLGVQILDVGAESTRPGAHPLTLDEEWERLKPHFHWLRDHYADQKVRPLVSVDTYNSKIAERSIELGVDIINDVSGMADENMLPILKNSEVSYALMHSLNVPANPENNMTGDVVDGLCQWLEEKLNVFAQNNISLDRIFFDPGIGFGKTSLQSIEILKKLEVFHQYPVRLMVGHSRKSFMKQFSPQAADARDFETLGASMAMVEKGVDVLRVHNPEIHIRTYRGWSHVRS